MISADITRKNYEKWLCMVGLIEHAGKRLYHEILHTKEGITSDGGQLYCKLEHRKNGMHYQFHGESLCLSNKIIDEKKFNLLVYMTLIYFICGSKYHELLNDVGDMRNKIFHMRDESICKADFEQLWNEACCKSHEYKFPDKELLKTLKTCDRFSVGEYKGILEFKSFS